MTKITGSGSGSISQRHGSADPDPDPHQNVMDPEHYKTHLSFTASKSKIFWDIQKEVVSLPRQQWLSWHLIRVRILVDQDPDPY
jgi:hypothetical protein